MMVQQYLSSLGSRLHPTINYWIGASQGGHFIKEHTFLQRNYKLDIASASNKLVDVKDLKTFLKKIQLLHSSSLAR